MKTAPIREMFSRFWAEQDGVTAIEYALLAALIFGAIVVSVGALGNSIKALYDNVSLMIANAAP